MVLSFFSCFFVFFFFFLMIRRPPRSTLFPYTTLFRPHRPPRRSLYHFSAAVLQTHESKRVEGGVIASLSIPWGFSKGDDDLGGYHLTWPRDLVETAGGFLAVGAHYPARCVLRYLEVTQEPDGHWSQNMWLDGTPYWQGIQMDETALPILLVDLAAREGAIDRSERDALWPMVRRAAAFLARHGPVSPQDRWDEEPGYSPFTLATEIAALLVAADLADAAHPATAARYLRETATRGTRASIDGCMSSARRSRSSTGSTVRWRAGI